MKARSKFILLAFGVTLFFLAAPFFGGTPIRFADLFNPLSSAHRIVFELRIPRMLLALMVGGALAVLGATYQILFHNPLAEPYILGVSSAVILGVALSETCLGISSYSYWGPAIGFVAAMIVTALILIVYLSKTGQGVHRLILFGLGIQFVLSSILFLSLSYFSQHMGGGSLRWLFGQIPWLDNHKVALFILISLPFLIVLVAMSRHLDALSLGDSVSRTLGYSPVKTRVWLMLLTSAYVALIVAFTGAIGFVGLVVPHGVRLVFRPGSTRTLFVIAFFVGACFLVFSDILSRTILPPFEFPIGILTTLLGGPIFLFLLWKR